MAQTFAQYMAESGRQSELDRGATPESVGWGSSGGSYGSSFQSTYDAMKNEIANYIKELEDITNGDYDFAMKWLESNYKEAVGTDDSMRKQIIREVADDLEKRVGRLGYDYQTGKYRLETETNTATTRLNENTNIALQRLKEDERVLTDNFQKQATQARRDQDTSLNARGIMSDTRGRVDGLAGREVGDLESDITSRFSEISRGFDRDRFDLERNRSRGLFDISQAKDWGLKDLRTDVRRGYTDTQNNFDMNSDQYARERDRRLAELKRQKYENEQQARITSEAMTKYGTGAY